MRHVSQQGLALIKRFEGFSPTIYLDAAGLPTIGYGHLLRPGEAEMFKGGISEEAGIALLIKDVQKAEQAVLRLISVPLSDSDNQISRMTLSLRSTERREMPSSWAISSFEKPSKRSRATSRWDGSGRSSYICCCCSSSCATNSGVGSP